MVAKYAPSTRATRRNVDIAAAWAEFAESTAAGYSCPIPAEAVPTIPE